jgi:hypothetical protein
MSTVVGWAACSPTLRLSDLRINRLKELEEMRDSGDLYRRGKKEQSVINRELD